MTKIIISNPSTNQNSVKCWRSQDDEEEYILLPGTAGEFEVSVGTRSLLIVEVPSLIYIEKEVVGPIGRTVEVK